MAGELYVFTEAKLKEYTDEFENYYVKKVEGMGLSHNDLTDELKRKIETAGDSSFSGNYNDLIYIPTINNIKVQGDLTAEKLGLATVDQLPGIATTDKPGLIKPDQITTRVGADGTLEAIFDNLVTIEQLPVHGTNEEYGIVRGDDLTIDIQDGVVTVKDDLFAKLDDFTDVIRQDELATTLDSYVKTGDFEREIEEIKDEVSSAVNLRGSIAFEDLPDPSEENYRDMYDVEDAFVTDENFKVGAGQSYPAGSNVVVVFYNGEYKWDVFSGYINTSEFTLKSDFHEITTEEIKRLFSE